MMRSMFAGVVGLQAHQIRMDVIGNNIANVNTTGFKASRATFYDLLSQTLRSASRPQNQRGGTNPMQIGLGVGLASIVPSMTPGAPQVTGRNTDMAITGDGFFVLRGPTGGQVYSRDGNFLVDPEGYLTNAQGLRVMGWTAQNGQIDTTGPVDVIRLPSRDTMLPAKSTSKVAVKGNLDMSATSNTSITVPLVIYDQAGTAHTLNLVMTKTATLHEWSYTINPPSGANFGPVAGGTDLTKVDGTITFSATGSVQSVTGDATGPLTFRPPGGTTADEFTFTFDFASLTEFSGDTTITQSEDLTTLEKGYPAGTFEGFSVDSSGVLTGHYSNGLSEPIAQVALALFSNPSALESRGGYWVESNNSGNARLGAPGIGGRGAIQPGALEMSNVDLATEFTNMITTQRGYQANSRLITTADELLQELVNLKR
ncbi:flagellar hook protein FlgE [Caldinitratiruptor microaerophilus]|uniref:Flagellar hook protein FlgE n=1 Tax=Caldinitratiruptor microaerophilus TaxID=671077 RepID=A0AA35G7I7_9FIRM|nr:flagellar hook protein FlgE [Caldinitratiruptor microaerophilus]BDG59358.1 flagellar hook protein FlgE [Caldinitratiruptor microaerophilus]